MDDSYAAVSTPIYQTATFDQPDAVSFGPYDYSRSGNPTRDALERQMAELEGADRGALGPQGAADAWSDGSCAIGRHQGAPIVRGRAFPPASLGGAGVASAFRQPPWRALLTPRSAPLIADPPLSS